MLGSALHATRILISASWVTIVLGVAGVVIGVGGCVATLARAVAGFIRDVQGTPMTPADREPEWDMLPWFVCAAILGPLTFCAGWRAVRGYAREQIEVLRAALWLALVTSIAWGALGQVAPDLWLTRRDALLIPAIAAGLQLGAIWFCKTRPAPWN